MLFNSHFPEIDLEAEGIEQNHHRIGDDIIDTDAHNTEVEDTYGDKVSADGEDRAEDGHIEGEAGLSDGVGCGDEEMGEHGETHMNTHQAVILQRFLPDCFLHIQKSKDRTVKKQRNSADKEGSGDHQIEGSDHDVFQTPIFLGAKEVAHIDRHSIGKAKENRIDHLKVARGCGGSGKSLGTEKESRNGGVDDTKGRGQHRRNNDRNGKD